MHLTRQTDAANRRRIDAALLNGSARRFMSGAPPVFGLLLGPRRSWRAEWNVLA